ncbi:carboxypeptidase-like regulatory domain-containing protein [Flavobacterium silvaticum]|uniref:Carboxypeptidase-like regulatory domain-containing protein n=1 Tax=Flavobacterium silvaticum TaxID=1852020 RepID=A0A972FLV7_9FLAO|nr:carboxypeptidase-like regulatory domain-containing protein [Flavobacterium silvaticum]NMH28396.1 carboxypeptidase-like regulatory domain-containing protein [Flavobacterium silvaticum]
MRYFYFLIVVTFSTTAQVSGKIVESDTGKPIPFVNIRINDSDVGTSADENGSFRFEKATSETALVFSAVGYKSKTISIKPDARIELERDTYELGEINVHKRLETEKYTIGNYKKSDNDTWYGASIYPWKLARYYAFSEQLKKTPFLDKIEILTRSEIKNATFLVHFYEVNDDGSPGRDIADSNIIGIAKKGSGFTKIDLKPYQLVCPDNGFFIGIEWLIIDSNKKEEKINDEKGKEHLMVHYYPSIGSIVSTNVTSWFFTKSHSWVTSRLNEKSPEYQKYYDDHYAEKNSPMFKGFYERHERMKGKTLEFAFNLSLTN